MTFNRHINGDHLGACGAVAEKMAVERGAAVRADTVPDPYKFSNLVQAADANLSTAANLAHRLQSAMDFICGPQPQEAKNPAPPQDFTSVFDMLNERQRQIYVYLDQLDTELRRLERVVG